MNGLGLFRMIDEAFAPFLTHLGFSINSPRISGRLYAVSFSTETHSVEISFEPIDERILILVFTNEHGKLSEIDDRVKTPRLADLNDRYTQELSGEERSANESVFKLVLTHDAQERLLLKYAKELRLVLPRHLGTRPLDQSGRSPTD